MFATSGDVYWHFDPDDSVRNDATRHTLQPTTRKRRFVSTVIKHEVTEDGRSHVRDRCRYEINAKVKLIQHNRNWTDQAQDTYFVIFKKG